MKHTPARIAQLLFLALFIVLFLHTEYRGRDEINAAVNSFFRADPLVLVSYWLATWSFSWLLFPALLMIVATMLLGRFFCGWICPLGTILDLLSPKKRQAGRLAFLGGRLKYWLLLPLLSASLFNLNLSGLLDPIAILLRGLTFFIHPLMGVTAREGWVGLYRTIGEHRDSLAPVYELLRSFLLPFRETVYPLALFSMVLLLAIILLERLETRAWCRYLCPLGTLLGWLGRFSPFKRVPAGLCADCGQCRELCNMTFNQGVLDKEQCTHCLDCEKGCPHSRIIFKPVLDGWQTTKPMLPERRLLLGGMASGLLLALPVRFRSPDQASTLLRPPGVRDEKEFLEKCVRCGECMKVCLKNALYPAAWQSGYIGLYTPLVIPRLGYCEYNCTLCGQVCPTAAIPNLPVAAKRREVIGKAVFIKDHCLPFAKKMECIVCEEHCPIPAKAIRSREVTVRNDAGKMVVVKEPYVVEEICNGCGICEYVCPVETRAGIQVFAVKSRSPISSDMQSFETPLPY